MLTAYLDESLDEETHGNCVVAGFLGDEEKWCRFEPIWSEALKPKRGLHMASIKKWHNKTETWLKDLGSIPHNCGLESLFGAVKISDYWDLVKGTRAEKLSKGYFMALYPMAIMLLRYIPDTEQVKLVLEEQVHFEGNARIIFNTFSTFQTVGGAPKIAEVEFVQKQTTTRTQPGDYLAYALLQNYRDRNSVKAKMCLPITGDGMIIGCRATRAQIRFAAGLANLAV